MVQQKEYDVAIAGGGLAGLSLSIQLARSGYSVALFEKEKYPFHKVCGEYLSFECRDFLSSLGLHLSQMDLPVIDKLEISSPNGRILKHRLPLGGFGISRYLLDQTMAQLATNAGVQLYENCKVENILFADDVFQIETTGSVCTARVACGSFGKKSNLDIKWKRSFVTAGKSRLNNFIGVKYHIETRFPADTIALHNFDNGYCGIVKVEGDHYNLCYLSATSNLRNNENSISRMEQEVLCKNPHLQKIYSNSRFLFQSPLTISHISFEQKSLVEHHVLMIGDAAGMITPLCGNGMSMALHGSKIAAQQIDLFLQEKISRAQLEANYASEWQSHFSHRLRAGRVFQKLFANKIMLNTLIRIGRMVPAIVDPLVRATHGKPF